MSRSIHAPTLLLGLALAVSHPGAILAAPAGDTPHLANHAETAIAFAWIATGSWAWGADLLDDTEVLAPGAVLDLDLPEPARGEATMRLISADGFVTEVAGIRLRDLQRIDVDDGRVRLTYADGRTLLPVQVTSYTGGVDCLEDGEKDATCLQDRDHRLYGLAYRWSVGGVLQPLPWR